MSSFRNRSVITDGEDLVERPPTLSQDEKIMTALTPIFMALAGYVSTLVARYFPGVQVPKGQLIWAFVVGAAAVLFLVLKVLHSNDKRIATAFSHAEQFATGLVGELPAPLRTDADELIRLVDEHRAAWETELEGHRAAWEDDVLKKLPTVVAQSLRNLADGTPPAAPASPTPVASAVA